MRCCRHRRPPQACLHREFVVDSVLHGFGVPRVSGSLGDKRPSAPTHRSSSTQTTLWHWESVDVRILGVKRSCLIRSNCGKQCIFSCGESVDRLLFFSADLAVHLAECHTQRTVSRTLLLRFGPDLDRSHAKFGDARLFPSRSCRLITEVG